MNSYEYLSDILFEYLLSILWSGIARSYGNSVQWIEEPKAFKKTGQSHLLKKEMAHTCRVETWKTALKALSLRVFVCCVSEGQRESRQADGDRTPEMSQKKREIASSDGAKVISQTTKTSDLGLQVSGRNTRGKL